jgi:AcrR family transcriptional regulator
MKNKPDPANAARRRDRHASLVEAALAVIREKGVAATSVDDIVGAAGVAKGTFYLYFRTREEVFDAAAERLVEGVVSRIRATLPDHGRTPSERLSLLAAAIGSVAADPQERALVELFHRPENRAVHDRLMAGISDRLAPVIETLIDDGIRQGAFAPADSAVAARFVLAAFGALHSLLDEGKSAEPALGALVLFLRRGLGERETGWE